MLNAPGVSSGGAGRRARDGRLAGTVVLAAGCWSGGIDGLPAGAAPVRPVKGQILTLARPPADALITRDGAGDGRGRRRLPRAPRRRPGCVGATVEERGWDTTVTAGGVYELLRDAAALVPGVDEVELVGCGPGLRPGSPDDPPMIGASVVDGLVIATGHYRNGILLTPVTADAVVAAMVGERAAAEARRATEPVRLGPGRFAPAQPGAMYRRGRTARA